MARKIITRGKGGRFAKNPVFPYHKVYVCIIVGALVYIGFLTSIVKALDAKYQSLNQAHYRLVENINKYPEAYEK